MMLRLSYHLHFFFQNFFCVIITVTICPDHKNNCHHIVLQNYPANGVIDLVNASVMLVRYSSRAFALL